MRECGVFLRRRRWLELPDSSGLCRCNPRGMADAAAGRASYWDALFVTTAGQAGCTIVLTEDMSDGGILGGLEIHNPFAAAGGLADLACRLLGLS
jgi:hypothetical protein